MDFNINKDSEYYSMTISQKLYEEYKNKYHSLNNRYEQIYSKLINVSSNAEEADVLTEFIRVLTEYLTYYNTLYNSIEKVSNELIKSGADRNVVKEAADDVRMSLNETIEHTKRELTTTKASLNYIKTGVYKEAADSESSKNVLSKVKSLIQKSHANTVKAMKNFSTKFVRFIASFKSTIKSKVKGFTAKK